MKSQIDIKNNRLIKNNSKILVIIFHATFSIIDEKFYKEFLDNKITAERVQQIHKGNLHFFQFAMKTKEADFLFLEDYFSELYGWYMFDKDKFIYNELNQELDNFIEENGYKRAIALGSSKGGTGAFLHSLMSTKISDCFIMIPDLCKSLKFLSENGKAILFNNNEEFQKKLTSFFDDNKYLSLVSDSKKHFTVVSGIRDNTYRETCNIVRTLNSPQFENIKSTFYTFPTQEKHMSIVGNHDNMIYQLFRSVVTQEPLEDERTVWQVDEQAYIISYEGLKLDRR